MAKKYSRINPKNKIKKSDENYKKKLKYIRQFESLKTSAKLTAQQKRKITIRYKHLIRFKNTETLKTTPAQKRILKEAGFITDKKGVRIPKAKTLKQGKLQVIPGIKTSVLKSGVIKEQIKQRADYIIPLTKKQKREFLSNPEKVFREIYEKNGRSFGKKPIYDLQVAIQTSAGYQHIPTMGDALDALRDELNKYEKDRLDQVIKNMTGIRIIVENKK